MSLTAAIIVELAFKKILETSAGELSKKFTVDAIAKMDELRQMIQDKFTGNSRAETAINAIRVRVDGWDYPPQLSVRSERATFTALGSRNS